MKTLDKIVALIVVSILVVGYLIVNYAWVSSCPLTPPGLNVQYTFSEFEEVDDTGIYVSEVLEMDRGEMYQCSSDNKVRLSSLEIYLMDNEGFTNSTWDLWSLQDNYAGNNSKRVDSSVEIANDNGTEFPIHFENQMDNDFEKYNYELYLSVGDKIKVYGSGSEAKGPAENGWYIRIETIIWGDPLSNNLVIP